MSDPTSVVLSFCDRDLEVRCPSTVAAEVAALLPDHLGSGGHGRRLIEVLAPDATGHWRILDETEPGAACRLEQGDVLAHLMDRIVRALVFDQSAHVVLHAGAVARDGLAIVLPGRTGAGKSSLVAWLIDLGFQYLTDEIVVVNGDGLEIEGLRRSLVLKPGSAAAVSRLSAFSGRHAVVSGDCTLYAPPPPARSVTGEKARCRLLVLPQFAAGCELSIGPLSAAQVGARLMECNLNARNLADGGLRTVGALARSVPAVALTYGGFDQFAGVFEILARIALDGASEPGGIRRFLAASGPKAPPQATEVVATSRPVPPPTPRRSDPKALTVGMATYDDYDGVYFTLQALRLYHGDMLGDAEFIVVDNNPTGLCSEALKAFEKDVPGYRYVPMLERSGTAVRDVVFAEASGALVLCMDCHVLLARGAIGGLQSYLRAHPETPDLLQGPMVADDLGRCSTHFDPVWRQGMFGVWASDDRGQNADAPPFEIPMQGLGLFACRKAAWPGFNPRFRGFGGEEGYIHEKVRRRGGRTLCLPFLRWAHRFRRPLGTRYPNTWDDRIRNYMIGHRELGWPTAPVESHFLEFLGEATARPIIERISRELEAEKPHAARPAARSTPAA